MSLLEDSRGPIWICTAKALNPGTTNPMDLIEIVAGAGARLVIRRLVIAQYNEAGDANAEMVGLQVLRNQDTGGSGGSALSATGLTPSICNMRQFFTVGTQTQITPATPSFTGSVGNTTIATSPTNAVHLLEATAFNASAGYQFYPAIRAERWPIDFSQRLVVRLTPHQTVAALFNLTMWVQDIAFGDV